MLENTHDQASREMYTETQIALIKRTMIADPETLAHRIEEAKRATKESDWDQWGEKVTF